MITVTKFLHMIQRKDGSDQNLDDRNRTVSSEFQRVNDEDTIDTRDISNEIEEGDEEIQEGDEDEESENDELTEADFDIDEEDDDDDEDID
jgi:hypothetical protein